MGANDTSGNENTTESVTFTVSIVVAPDLTVSSKDIVFSDPVPTEGDNITINATIHNIGTADANNSKIEFVVNTISIETKTVNTPANTNKTVTFNWTSTITGTYNITIIADPDNLINETDETNNNATKSITVTEPLRLLIIPINWQGTLNEYQSSARNIAQYFLSRIPLSNCSNKFENLTVDGTDYDGNGTDWVGWYCNDPDIIPPKCNQRNTLDIIDRCARQYKASTGEDYDFAAAVVDQDICDGIGGWSDGEGNLPVVIGESSVLGIVTHELGHEFGLRDQYCNCIGTAYESYCGSNATNNPLRVELGCNVSVGGGCCWTSLSSPYPGCFKWCYGNFDRFGNDTNNDSILDTGQRSTMSNKILAPDFETGHYDIYGYSHLQTLPALQCSTRYSNSSAILEISLVVSSNDTVTVNYIDVTFGSTPIVSPSPGDYSLRVLDENDTVLYRRDMHLHFILFSDPPTLVDYSSVYDRIRYDNSMHKVQLYHSDVPIFSQNIGDVCNYNGICEENENYYSCPHDCESYVKDRLCNNAEDDGCDPDCLEGFDPDCKPDLTISSEDITFSDDNPIEGETITINATIHNIGEASANNVVIQLYDGKPITGTQIGSDQMINSIVASETGNAQVTWNATLGNHTIYVVVDPYNSISEKNESNNIANKTINVVMDITPPEVRISYDSHSGDLIVEGIDNIDEDVDVSYKEICLKESGNKKVCIDEGRLYTLTDDAGNRLLLEMKYDKKDQPGAVSTINIQLIGAEYYVAGDKINETKYEHNWERYTTIKKQDEIKTFEENVYMEHHDLTLARYNAKKNETVIIAEGERQILEGLHVVNIITDMDDDISTEIV